jgi:hypothetical protein
MREPLEVYLNAFNAATNAMETLLEATIDLTRLQSMASEILTDPDLLEAVRYLSGPPISADDLKVLADASLARTRLKSDPDMARRVLETILYGLDRARFPWVAENREPTEAERATARVATAALIAQRRVFTARQNESKEAQEDLVASTLLGEAQFTEVAARDIHNISKCAGERTVCPGVTIWHAEGRHRHSAMGRTGDADRVQGF